MASWLMCWTVTLYLASSNSSHVVMLNWEKYEPPYPPGYKLISTITVVL